MILVMPAPLFAGCLWEYGASPLCLRLPPDFSGACDFGYPAACLPYKIRSSSDSLLIV